MKGRSLVARNGSALLVLALALGCARESAESASSGESGSDPAPSRSEEAATRDSVPAAILGEGPPPRGEPVHYFPADSGTSGYLVTPEGEGPFPAVILIHEWNGLNDRVRQVADAFADQGYVALAADLYSGRIGSTPEENRALTREVREDLPTVIANLDAAAAFLRSREDVTGKVATMGWCFGGGIALSYALGGEHHDGTAIFYGSLVTDPVTLAAIDHPIYGTFAGEDDGIPPEEVERFVAALHDAGIPADVHIYDSVEHGFWLWVDRDPETNLEPAADAWRRLLAYLERTIG
ncbi:MAG: dienelactone hydrolase family protein [Gemmatimonadota bacterium]